LLEFQALAVREQAPCERFGGNYPYRRCADNLTPSFTLDISHPEAHIFSRRGLPLAGERFAMALFNKEPEKTTTKPGSVTTPSVSPSATPQPPVLAQSSPAPAAAPQAQARPATPAEGRAYLDRGAKVSGKLSFDGPARIDGEVDGEITAKESIAIGESAAVTAQIRAASVVVAGKVSGDIIATQRIEIRPSAKVIGNLSAPVLVVHEGAQFEGHCSMQPEGVREDRKVTVFPKEERPLQAAAGGQKQA
jgi:cytoskeletal protein CcmA (bactofilin family)